MERRSWVRGIEEEAQSAEASKELEQWRKQSIYRVPLCVRELNPKAYRPQLVSFGPYHHGNEALAPMEQHKRRALLYLLRRSKKPLSDFVLAVEEVLPELQSCYEGLSEAPLEDFLRLIVVDACFMLEILSFNAGRTVLTDYHPDDPVFSAHGTVHIFPFIKRDMLLLENQLPLIALFKLLSVQTAKPANPDDINFLVLKLCSPDSATPAKGIELGLHPLDVYRRRLLQGQLPLQGRRQAELKLRMEPAAGEIMRSAVELYEAGIRFKRSSAGSLVDVEFRHGVLSLRGVVVDDTTQYIYLNLMAFERLHVGAGSEVTSYVFFMDSIIDSAKDVSLLHSKGIIQNALGSDKAVAKLFNSLTNDVTLEQDSALDEVQRRVNKYCSKRLNLWRANLIHTYFRSPWAVLSLAAALFLLALSVVQTLYSVLPFYHNR